MLEQTHRNALRPTGQPITPAPESAQLIQIPEDRREAVFLFCEALTLIRGAGIKLDPSA
jgi:hypothetical protein